MSMVKSSGLQFDFIPAISTDNYATAIVIVPKIISKKIYDHISFSEAKRLNPYGFHQSTATPIEYIEKNLRGSILNNLKEFLLRYTVLNFIYKSLRDNHISNIGSPLLADINIDEEFNFKFTFKLVTAQAEQIMDWHYALFKSPLRKNYKDLDKRAKEFIEEELIKEKDYKEINKIQNGDWVCFSTWLCDENLNPIFPEDSTDLWLRIGNDEVNIPFQEIFVDKFIGQSFITDNMCIQEYFNSQIENQHKYLITIKDIVNNGFFSIEQFKKHFKIKTHKSAHQKMIEIFSSTNDLSLRKTIIEHLFDFLLSKHKVNLPQHAITRQQRSVIEGLQEIPDYHVYRAQKDFNKNVQNLAIRQLQELVLTDYIAFQESINVDENDLKNYLNLTLRPRANEFIYFKHSAINPNEQEWPIPAELLKSMCLKEKTLTHILQILS